MDVLDYNGLAHFYAKEVDAYNRGYPDKAEYAFVSKRFKRVLDRFDGKSWTTEDEVTSSASVPVPTGAKMVDISTIGGASVKADVEKIVSRGKNLFHLTDKGVTKTENGVTYTISADGSKITINGTSSANVRLPLFGDVSYGTSEYPYRSGTYNISINLISGSSTANVLVYLGNTQRNGTFTIEKGSVNNCVQISNNHTYTNAVFAIQLEEGSSATPYSPHGDKGTIAIPSAIRQLQGYGEANGTDINTVDFDSMVFHKKGYYNNGTWVADVQDIDISAYPVETMLPVEAGGSITFEQQDNTTVAVPAALTFAVDLNDY